MAHKMNKRKAVEPGAFPADIKRGQSDKRRRVNDIIRKVRAVYISTTNDAQIAEEIESLLADIDLELDPFGDGTPPTAPTRGGRVLLVTGDAGAGKTRALAKAFLECAAFAGFNVPGEASALLSLVAPSPFTLAALGNDGVTKLGYVGGRQIPEGQVWPMLRNLMRELGIRVLHIDEAQHGDQIVNPVIHQNVEDTLKRLLQESDWPLWLILSGLPELAKFCQDDRSVLRRVHHVRFDALNFPDDVEKVREAIAAISEPCGGLDCSCVLSDEFIGRLIHASLNQFGILVEFIQDAIQECLLTDADRLDVAHFADAYMARTGEKSTEGNVFEAEKWYDVDVASALFEQPVDENGEPVGRKRIKPSAGMPRR